MPGMEFFMCVADAGGYRLSRAAKSAHPVEIFILRIFSPRDGILFESFNVL
jgi:hypothetical protein